MPPFQQCPPLPATAPVALLQRGQAIGFYRQLQFAAYRLWGFTAFDAQNPLLFPTGEVFAFFDGVTHGQLLHEHELLQHTLCQ